MSTPNRFLHAESAGAYHLPTTRPMLPIRQNLNRLTELNRTQRAVLIEVCGLAENGKHGAFTGSNDLLCQAVGGTPRTITRALAELQRLELLLIEGATKLRRITTTSRLRVCYTGSGAAQHAAVEALNSALSIDKMSIDRPAKTALSIDNGGSVYRHSVSVSIDNGGSAYKETKNYNQDNQEEEKEGPLRSALAAAEKKIAELESALEEMTYQRNQLRASVLAQRPDPASPTGANASASHTRGAAASGHKFTFEHSKVATPEGFATLATALNYPAAYAPHYLAHMAVKAGTETRDERGWQNFAQRYLAIDANSETGLITTPPNDSATSHANRSTFSQRPISGAKPTGDGAQLARSLAERRAG